MSQTTKKVKISKTFKFPVTVEVQVPNFEPFASLKFLDFARLGKGNHKIEIGVVKSDCCSKLARAIIRKGMVTGIEVESCHETESTPPELVLLVKEARRQLRLSGDTKFQPVSVTDFMSSTARIIDVFGDGRCVTICVFDRCYRCCKETASGGGTSTIEVCGAGSPRKT